MAIPNLLFVDANIWLDFYRVRNDTGLRLLGHTEALADRLIVTYQLESEYKRNRQAALFEGMQELKPPQQIPRPGIFSDAAAAKMMAKNVKEAEKRVKKLRDRVVRALRDPAAHDPVYQSCQRLFQKTDDLTLRRNDPLRRIIRRRAFRRFLHGCPPRKRNDTSIGDAFNWEWMVYCATARTAGLVIVTRDSDYGLTIDKESYINDALRQEFSERVSRKRQLLLYSRLSDALRLFDVKVTEQEEASEAELVSRNPVPYNVRGGNALETMYGLEGFNTWLGKEASTAGGNLVSLNALRNLLVASPGSASEIGSALPKEDPPKEQK